MQHGTEALSGGSSATVSVESAAQWLVYAWIALLTRTSRATHARQLAVMMRSLPVCRVLLCCLVLAYVCEASIDWPNGSTFEGGTVIPGDGVFLNHTTSDDADNGSPEASRRRLLQDTFDIGPQLDDAFTLDGLPIGFGGVLPPNRGIDAFTNYVYAVIFKNFFNTGLEQFTADVFPTGINLVQYLPASLRGLITKDVVALVGYDVVDTFIHNYYPAATASQGDIVPSGCIGPIYSLKMDSGVCTIAHDGSVSCTQPTITFLATPLTCNLAFRAAASMTGTSFTFNYQIGQPRSGTIGPAPGVYNFGAAYNITRLYLGYNTASRRVLNAFGVARWYRFLANFVALQLERIITGIVAGSTPFFTEGPGAPPRNRVDFNDYAETESLRSASGGTKAPSDGMAALTGASRALASKVAGLLGIDPSNNRLVNALASGSISSLLGGSTARPSISTRSANAGSGSSGSSSGAFPLGSISTAPVERQTAAQRSAAKADEMLANSMSAQLAAAQGRRPATGQEQQAFEAGLHASVNPFQQLVDATKSQVVNKKISDASAPSIDNAAAVDAPAAADAANAADPQQAVIKDLAATGLAPDPADTPADEVSP